MSVVGIDLGTQSTKIGVARNKGIDIVRTSSLGPALLPALALGISQNSRFYDMGLTDLAQFCRSQMRSRTEPLRTFQPLPLNSLLEDPS